jgi:hypothetical protein
MLETAPLAAVTYDAIVNELYLDPPSQMIDYDAILEALVGDSGARERLEDAGRLMGHIDREQFLREYRTIGFINTRQTGKTRWALEQFTSRPGEVSIVVVNRELMVTAMTEARTTEGDKFFTARDITETAGQHKDVTPRLCTTKFVIVQDSMYVLDRVGYRFFYKWLAMSEVEDIWVILT